MGCFSKLQRELLKKPSLQFSLSATPWLSEQGWRAKVALKEPYGAASCFRSSIQTIVLFQIVFSLDISFFARLNQPEGQVAVFFYLPCNVAVVVFFSIYLAT
jgi:hypothetical protein